MNRQLTKASLWILLCLTPVSIQVQAAAEAAKVIMARGTATAIDEQGESRKLKRRSVIYVGDTLSTGDDSLMQLRFTDKAVMTLRENTRFQIEEYQAGDDNKGGEAIMKLLEGGFRTITGSIGKGSSDNYKVSTNAASIGIRGTHYEALETLGKKLLVAVWQGGVKLENPSGQLNLGQNAPFSFAEIAPGKAPTGLMTPPEQLQKGLPLPASQARRPAANKQADSSGQSSTEQSSDDQPANDQTSTEADGTVADGSEPPPDDTLGPLSESEFTESDSSLGDSELNDDPLIALEETNPLDTLTQQEDLNFTETNPELSDTLSVSSQDPRLTIQEFDQIGTTSTLGAGVIAGPSEEILATIISMQDPTPFNYLSAGSVSFGLQYYYDTPGSTPIYTDVVITLESNISDINSLIADIEDELIASGAPVGVRESMMEPGKLEFYTTNGDETLQFGIVFFDTTSSSATDTDLSSSLGGIMTGTFGFGGIDHAGSGTMKVVYDANGEPVFLVPNDEGQSTGSGPPPPEFIDPANLGKYEVVRRGEAVLTDFNPSVGGRSNISWGVWNTSGNNPVYIYEDPNDPSVLAKENETVYWLTAEAANSTELTGTATFAATPEFIGSGSDGMVTGVTGSFDVNFDSGEVSNGSLNVMTVNQTWNVLMDGAYEKAQAHMDIIDGQISGSVNCSNCVKGRMSGVFVAPGDAFAGGFDMQKFDDRNTHVEGLMLMEKQ
ncbi:FecR family protein [Hahella ganghwensis]|uniref:FecR family protein n=1 Tax=Hahella ganghwensis TaxID=286420 RepID=UPI000378B632|nr:FecR domain-containing protein [Hahella ganghwensis]